MGVRLLTQDGKTALYDSVTDTAFGPVVYGWDEPDPGMKDEAEIETADSEEVALLFLDWLSEDARTYAPKDLGYEWGVFVDALNERGYEALREEVPEP